MMGDKLAQRFGPVRRKRLNPEADLQKTVAALFDRILDPAKVHWSATLNGVYVTPKVRATLKEQGLRPGVLDIKLTLLVGERRGQDFWIELKSKSGSATAEQKVLLAAYGPERAGTAKTVEQVIALLALWNIPTREHRR